MSRARTIIEAESPRSVLKRLPKPLPRGVDHDYYLAIRKPPMADDEATEYVPIGVDENGRVFPQDGEYGLLNDVQDAMGLVAAHQRYPAYPEMLSLTDEEEDRMGEEVNRYTSQMYSQASKGILSGQVDGVAGPRAWRIVRWPEGSARPHVYEAVSPRELLKSRFGLQSVKIVGRRWFQRTYGNTYHTADIYVNDKLVHTTPMQYGYGDQYMQTGWAWLENNGYIPKDSAGDPPWRVAEKMGFDLSYYANDVRRRRDL
jgi:hypothetical protein